MSTLPTTPEQITPVRLEYGRSISAFAEDSNIPTLTEKVEDGTAQILAFRPRTKAAPETTIPTVIVTNSAYNPGVMEAQQNDLIGQILSSYIFASKEEQMTNQLSSLEKVENIIETRFHQSMQLAAKEDVQNGVFG